MTEREALRITLEALEKFRYHIANNYEINAAITAARKALAQPEERKFCERCGKRLGQNDWDVHTCTPPQLEQEHVEWGVDWGPDGNSVSIIKRLADGGIEVVGWEYAPHPPQRKPLSDEWIRSRCGQTWVFETAKQWIRIAEATHGIKE